MITHRLFYCVLASIFLSACSSEVDHSKVPVAGVITCNSPLHENDIQFHTDKAKSFQRNLSDAYLIVNINGADTQLKKSDGWVCTDPNGKVGPLFEVE